jgi:hypothetical protein
VLIRAKFQAVSGWLRILNGGSVVVTGFGAIATFSPFGIEGDVIEPLIGTFVTVEGAGSTLTIGDELLLGIPSHPGYFDYSVQLGIGAGGTVNVATTTRINAAGVNLTGGGTLNTQTLVLNSVGGLITSADWLNVSGGAVHVTGTTRIHGGRRVNLTGGTLSTQHLDTLGGGIFNFTGGRLAIAGTYFGDHLDQQGGTLAAGNSPGSMSITGDYTMAAPAVLEVELAGNGGVAGTDFDQLVVSGNATLGGTLDLSYINAFTATPGQSFVILTAATLTGTFAQVTGTDAGPGKVFRVQYNANNVTLVVDPASPGVPALAPGGWMILMLLLAVAGAAVLCRNRRFSSQ